MCHHHIKIKIIKILRQKLTILTKGIRRKIHQFWSKYKLPTIEKILVTINYDKNLPNLSKTSLYRLLKTLMFEYVKINLLLGEGVFTKYYKILYRKSSNLIPGRNLETLQVKFGLTIQ